MAEKVKILCLHGYRQTDETFRAKTGSLRKLLKKRAELVYINAPLEVPPDDDREGGRGWWFSREPNFFKAHYESTCIKGFQDSIDSVLKAVEIRGPFDGILGFSQGAAMVALICAMQQQNLFPNSFRFAILIAGFRSRSTPHQPYYMNEINIPSLHVYGTTDEVIQKEMSEELVPIFQNPTSLVHSGGHYVPASAGQKEDYLKFIDSICPNNHKKIIVDVQDFSRLFSKE